MQTRRFSKFCLSAAVFCLFLCIQSNDVDALVTVAAQSNPSPQCRGLECMRLRGGFFGLKKKEEPAPKPEPFPLGKFAQASVVTVATMGLLSADPEQLKEVAFLGIQRWQLLMAGSYGAFFLANMVPGRLDTVLGRPKAVDRRFFTPAGWAFAIWAPIFLCELLMSFSVFFPGSLAAESSSWLPAMAPFYAASSLFQAIWCFCFRPWALQHQWIPASLLTFGAIGLFFAQQQVSAAVFEAGSISLWGKIVCWVPVSLHFGWLVAASALSWNGVLAQRKVNEGFRIAAAIATSYAAWAFLGLVSVARTDPLPALTGGWALLAVSKGHEVLRGTVDDLALAALNNSAFLCAVLSFATAAYALAAPHLLG